MLDAHEADDREFVHVQRDIALKLDRPHALAHHLGPSLEERRPRQIGLVQPGEQLDDVREGRLAKGRGGEVVAEAGEQGRL